MGTSRPSSDAIEGLLLELCERGGYCLPPEEAAALLAVPPGTVDEFTDAVLAAEGLSPELHKEQRKWVRTCVEKWFDLARE